MAFYKIVMIILVLIIIFGAVKLWLNEKHSSFEKYLKAGDIVKYYVGEEKRYSVVKKYGKIWTDIYDGIENQEMRVPTNSLMPSLGFKYGPKKFIE